MRIVILPRRGHGGGLESGPAVPTRGVMITDELNFCAFEWRRGEGIVFPTAEDLGLKGESPK
jgi:hypothetical protein